MACFQAHQEPRIPSHGCGCDMSSLATIVPLLPGKHPGNQNEAMDLGYREETRPLELFVRRVRLSSILLSWTVIVSKPCLIPEQSAVV
jgi:hypothetical protein